MTKGNPLPLILRFALPLLLGNIFQQLYTVVDTMVVGKSLGVSALAALGASDWLNWLMVARAQGLTQGFAVLMAQAFGAKETERLRQDLDSANTRIREMDFDARQRLDDVLTTIDSLMNDKKRLETEIQQHMKQLEGMKAAFASHEAIKSERDSALLRIEEERKAAQEIQQQAVAFAKEEMQHFVDAANERTQQALIAQASAQSEAASLRRIRDANNALHETIGAQRVQISMLEHQVTELQNRCDAQAQQIQELKTKE